MLVTLIIKIMQATKFITLLEKYPLYPYLHIVAYLIPEIAIIRSVVLNLLAQQGLTK